MFGVSLFNKIAAVVALILILICGFSAACMAQIIPDIQVDENHRVTVSGSISEAVNATATCLVLTPGHALGDLAADDYSGVYSYIVYADTLELDRLGRYAFDFKIGKAQPSGQYTVYIRYSDTQAADVGAFYVINMDGATESLMLSGLKAAEDNAIIEVLRLYAESLYIDLESSYNAKDAAYKEVFRSVFAQNIKVSENAMQVRAAFDNAVLNTNAQLEVFFTEQINSTEISGVISLVSTFRGYMDIDYENDYNLLDQEYKANFRNLFADKRPFTGFADAAEAFNSVKDEIDTLLALNGAASAASFAAVLLDKAADLDIDTLTGSKYGKLTLNLKEAVMQRMFLNRPYSGKYKLKEEFDKSVFIVRLDDANKNEIAAVLLEEQTLLGIDFTSKYGSLSSDQKVKFGEYMVSYKPFADYDEIKAAVEASIAEAKKPSGSAGGNGGKGGGTIVSKTTPQVPPTVNVPPASDGNRIFADMDASHWAFDSVKALYNDKVINGMEDGAFYPDLPVTREQFVKMLVVAFGLYDDNAKTDFNDIKSGEWYYSYVASAQKNSIVTGDGHNFGIGQPITRQDAAVMVKRISDFAKINLTQQHGKEAFGDTNVISEYAAEAVSSLYSAGVINGAGEGMFRPLSNITRAEAAKLIYGIFKVKYASNGGSIND